ncbi:MAG TPA: hypothetical protein VIV12_13825 [Streptosporangiaceae bacterium]
MESISEREQHVKTWPAPGLPRRAGSRYLGCTFPARGSPGGKGFGQDRREALGVSP